MRISDGSADVCSADLLRSGIEKVKHGCGPAGLRARVNGLSRLRVTRFHGRSDTEGPMGAVTSSFSEKSRLSALLEQFSHIQDPRDPWRVAHPLPEVLLLAACGMIPDRADYVPTAAWRSETRRVGKGW